MDDRAFWRRYDHHGQYRCDLRAERRHSVRLRHNGAGAAAINARALATRHEAEEAVLAVEDSFIDFSRRARALSERAAALNSKRDELDRVSRFATTSPEIAGEIDATVAAIGIALAHESAQLRAAEDGLLSHRDVVDQAAPLAHGKASEAVALGEAYLKALED